MWRDAEVGSGLDADPQVILGYPAARPVEGPLVVGPHARLRTGTVLYAGSVIGARFESGHNVVVREQCRIGNDVCIWSGTVVDYGCRLGHSVKVHCNCYLAQFTDIGDDAFLAPGVTIANDLYPGDRDSAAVMSGPSIGPGAQIGVNVTILPFVRIGSGALIGAGATVTRDIPDRAVAYGNPAVVRGSVDDLPRIGTRVTKVQGAVSRFRLADGAP
jgi:acetyltransferase-like isoleucine patch superfamily enzyme